MIQLDLNQYDELDYEVECHRYNKELDAMWEHVEKHLGKERMTEVTAFTWRDAYFDEYVKRMEQHPIGSTTVYTAHTHLNAIRLKNGDVISMPTIAKPTVPGRAPVTLKKVYS